MSVDRPAIARLAAEVASHLQRVEAEANEIARLAGTAGGPAGDALWATAAHLHFFYTGVESIIERVADAMEGEIPSGSDWHRRLLAASSIDIPDVRPAVFAAATAEALKPYLAFRHFFRHAYGVSLDWTKMHEKAEQVRRIYEFVAADVARFRTFLDALARTPPEPGSST